MRTQIHTLVVLVAPILVVQGIIAAPFTAAAHAATPTPRVAALSNPSFAGYQVTKTTGKITEASTTFVVPTITCKKTLSGVGPSVIVQSRANKKGAVTQSGAGVGVACENKQPIYQAVVIVNGNETNDYELTPGDHVVATVHITATSTKVDLHDVTSGDDKSASGDGNTGAVALIGDSGISFGTTSVGIDPFTKTSFTGAKVNNKPVGKVGAVAVQRTHGKTVQIAVSRLVKKQNFALTFKNSK